MDFVAGPLGILLPKLAQLLQDEYNLHKGAKKGVEFLYKELEAMHAVLHKVGEVPKEQLDDLQRIWARDVRELSYDMEDIIDTFMVDVQGPDPPSKSKAKKIFKKMIRKVNKTMARREIAQDIRDIKERVTELADRRARYKIDDIAPVKITPVDPRLKALYTESTEIVGIEEAKEEVIKMFTGGDGGQQKRIVSIAGFGGLGKTTLAKAVYDEIKKDYCCTAFVSVSRDPDPKKLLNDMLYELHKGGHPGANLHEIKHLIDLVRDFLRNKRYLIVIDDIWDKEPWDEVIGHALIENNMSSRIITTTRIIDVAEHVGGCYQLKPLSDESSEMLFYGRIFGTEVKCPKQFSEVSKKILKKCGGVPLAIVTTSSLLANKSENIKEWLNVCESIGSGLGRNPNMDSMRKILLLSYYDLPSHMKTCLLYLSIFPEDYEISKDRLIWRWVAEGFVQQDRQAGEQSSLEIGESYFNELLNRSLIQPADLDMDDMPDACRVHDAVLDLIISLSAEECFTTTVLGDGMKSNIRRLSLHNNTSWPTMNMPKLRSLTTFKPFNIFEPAGVVIDPTTMSRYRLLRVLDLQGCRLKDLASLGFLGSLCHLRYLSLSTTTDRQASTDQLPEEIGKLRLLQTLDLSETAVEELPSSIVIGLGQLMCLRGCGTDLLGGLKMLTSLEVLESVTVTFECITEDLVHLTQLRVLDVDVGSPGSDEWRACAKALVESLGKLKRIESLGIFWRFGRPSGLDDSVDEPLGNLRRLRMGIVETLPTLIRPASVPVLSYLDIWVRCERREDIQLLGTLPCLRHLSFLVWSAPQQEETLERCAVGPDAFPSAVSCRFYMDGAGVVPSMFPRGAMPRLRDLRFSITREHLCGFSVDDFALAHLPSLRSVNVGLYGHPDEEGEKVKSVREKLEHEAALHPNHPLCFVPN